MIEICQTLANQSKGENPGGFAKIARTLTNQYFFSRRSGEKRRDRWFLTAGIGIFLRFAKTTSKSLAVKAFQPAERHQPESRQRD